MQPDTFLVFSGTASQTVALTSLGWHTSSTKHWTPRSFESTGGIEEDVDEDEEIEEDEEDEEEEEEDWKEDEDEDEDEEDEEVDKEVELEDEEVAKEVELEDEGVSGEDDATNKVDPPTGDSRETEPTPLEVVPSRSRRERLR